MHLSDKDILEFLGRPKYKPLDFGQLCDALSVPKKGRKRFRRMLRNLRRDKKIIQIGDKRYRAVTSDDYTVGIIEKHPDGYGFLKPQDGSEDIYLGRYELLSVLDGDRLKVLKMERPNRQGKFQQTAKVIDILERGKTKIVGKLAIKGKTAFVIPQKSNSYFGAANNISIPFTKDLLEAKNKIVVCLITHYPKENQHAVGQIIETLGHMGTQEVDFSVMIAEYDLRHVFPPKVMEHAQDLQLHASKATPSPRKDLRDLPFITIDGETAKDFDDAVTVKKLSNGNYRLWVAIADVSFYIPEKSPIDEEAYLRATSVYFPGGVIPMLPEVLSNDLCSLNPHEPKMTFCCEMEFTPKGERKVFSIYESVIESRHRMTYTSVQAILDGNVESREKYKDIVSDIEVMNELKEILRQERLRRGCLDFDLPESELILDVQGRIETIVKRERWGSHMLIEEFMIAANETVAEFMFNKKRAFIYRIHEEPDPDVLFQFHELAHNLGYTLKPQGEPHPKHYSELLEQTKGKPEETVIHTALLRSMKQAVYSSQNRGHFGLASECYTHFTSPIRRYPDLMVHRLLKGELKKKTKDSDTIDGDEQLEKDAKHCSRQERTVEEAEREFIALKKAQFMKDKVGQEFVGFISGVKEFGFFVELEQFYIEGLVPMRTLEDDLYQFLPHRYVIEGRRHKKEFRLGDKVTIQVAAVDLDKRQIDFYLVD